MGTGLGTETVDNLVPRDFQGRPFVPATHLKGLLRENIGNIVEMRGWPEEVSGGILGEEGDDGEEGRISSLHIGDAIPVAGSHPSVVNISRTALNQHGTALPGALRTVEAVAAGSRFKAKARMNVENGGVLDLLTRLGFMSIEAVGGGRTRGSGFCRIRIDGETRTPGELLRLLDKKIAETERSAFVPDTMTQAAKSSLGHGTPVWFKLVFRAESGICCPDIPINGATNHVRSGPVIPSSAVQGAIITRLAETDSGLAAACFADSRFRAWPLLPVSVLEDEVEVPFGFRVDISHRLSKLPDSDGRHDVRDPAIEPYHWSDVAGGSPLKSSDGILRRDSKGGITLWKASDLPRLITSHSVHFSSGPNGNRSLFSVESLAPMVFSGLISMPEEAAAALEKTVANDPFFFFGKARSVRGGGRLELRTFNPDDLFSGSLPTSLPGRVFIVQSPLALPDDYLVVRANEALEYLADSAGWGKVLLESQVNGNFVARTSVTCGIRFGWNRHGIGPKADERHNRLQARRVILPGSVLVLAAPLGGIREKLLAGLGDGRESGFGSLLPHPGVAMDLYQPKPKPPELASVDAAGRKALDIFQKAGCTAGPSPSQIASVGRRQGQDAVRYLDQQVERGSVKHWHRWKPVLGDVKELVGGDPSFARRTLRAWQNLAIINRDKEQNR
jgi:CRISPR/Cas system CSM-associated protein Csm3 (group 7 of RAMP superfamily)